MRVLQTINSLSPQLGGPSSCTYELMQGLSDIGAGVNLLTVKCKGTEEHNLGEGCLWLKEVDNDYRTPLCFSRNLKNTLILSDYDVYHVNTLWMYQSHITCQIAREKKRPYILSPHGMLYPNALKIKRWKKWPMLKLWFNQDIHKAACLHATCHKEMEHCRSFGYQGPIAVIPNAVVFPDEVGLCKSKPKGKKQLGFLGRLHPIKKVENLLYAMALLTKEEQELLSLQIMGKYDEQYEAFLKAEVKRNGLEKCVEFVGFVDGREKYNRLSRLSALMVPSESENFGMIVPEALICGTPVYASTGTPWEELNVHGCGWWKDNSPTMIAGVMREILKKSEEEIIDMGARGRKLMEEKYEQHKVATMMKDLYEWVASGGVKPNFAYEAN